MKQLLKDTLQQSLGLVSVLSALTIVGTYLIGCIQSGL